MSARSAVPVVPASALLAAVLFFAVVPLQAALPRQGSVDAALQMPDGPAHIELGMVQSISSDGNWLYLSRAGTPLAVFAPGATPAPKRGNCLRIDGRLYTAGSTRALRATKMAVYVDGRTGKPTAPPPDPAHWPYLTTIELSNPDSPTVTDPAPPTLQEVEPQFDVEANTVADAKINGGSVVLYGVQVIGVYDANGVSPSFLYVQDRNTGSGSPRQIPCGIKVVPTDGAIDSLKPGDIVDVEGTVAACDSTDPECRIEDAVVEYVTWEPVPPPVAMTNKSTAGGEFGLQDALYLRTPDANRQIGYGLNSVGTLAKVCGRILLIECQEPNAGDHIIVWVEDGSGLERTVIVDGNPVVRKGLKVIYWADSATARRYGEGPDSLIVEDYVSFAGVVGAEFSEDSTPLPAPVLLVGRKNARDIIFVDGSTGDDDDSGADWSHAKATVQGALDIASEDDEIWIADGTYLKRENLNEDNVAVMTSGIGLYGGFHGDPNGETGRWQRGGSSTTILDCEGEYPVVRAMDLTAASRVDSLTIQRGEGGGDHGGGGFQWTGSEGVFTNNLIRWNAATVSLGAGISCVSSPCVVMHNEITANPQELTSAGGGILCDGHPSAYVAENEITNNRAGSGAGIFVEYSSPVMRDNIITGNTTLGYGGGIYMNGSSTGLVIRNQILNNGLYVENVTDGATHGGGIACVNASPRIEDNVIEGNAALYNGGGLFLSGSAAEVVDNTITDNTAVGAGGGIACGLSSPAITRNTFDSNIAGDYGGAISVDTSTPEITRNTFTSNNGGDRGGAIWISNSNLDIINNLFVGNHVTGTGGGAIYAESLWGFYSSPTSANIVNNTFAENSATDTPPDDNGYGGVALTYCNDPRWTTDLTFVNNIFYKNKARAWQETNSTGNSVYIGLYSTGSLRFSYAYSDVSDQDSYHYSGVDLIEGWDCFIPPSSPSIFLDESGGNYHLNPSGPSCTPIDRGHDRDLDNPPYGMVPLDDRDGLARPAGERTDMGAYEAQ